ncbi:MAG TPA: hypothetical protein VL549_08965 [Gemmatimonadales bacterium]|nr:hypothetical protein [Gemmatimonadales bacterium]
MLVTAVFLFAACADTTGPRIPGDLAGVWTTVLSYLGPADTITLLVPDASDSLAVALRRPGALGYVGVVHRSANRLTGTLNYPSGGGFTIDLVRLGPRLMGTLNRPEPVDTIKRVTFDRYVPAGPSFAGVWVTTSVVGADSGAGYLDTLLIKSDGRVQLASSLSESGVVICGASGLHGVYRYHDGGLVLIYAWPSQFVSPCSQIRLVDSIAAGDNVLTRTRHYTTGDVVETLTRR